MSTAPQSEGLIVSAGREVKLDVQHSSPPTQYYVGIDDQLWVMCSTQSAGVVVTVNYRLLMPNGSIQINQQTIQVANQRSAQYFSFPLTECWLLSIAAVANTAGNSLSSVYVELIISRAQPSLFNAAQALAQGYTYGNRPLSWPLGIQSTSVDCAGLIYTQGSGTPAAGADISMTVPQNAKWRLLALRTSLTTSAQAASRFVQLTLDDGVNIFAATGTATSQAASSGVPYNFAPGFTNTAIPGASVFVMLPNPVILMPGYRIRTSTISLQTGDQFAAAVALVEEWLLP